jgi:hypothetical protein
MRGTQVLVSAAADHRARQRIINSEGLYGSGVRPAYPSLPDQIRQIDNRPMDVFLEGGARAFDVLIADHIDKLQTLS